MSDATVLAEYWPFLVPLAAIECGLIVAALISIFRQSHYRHGNRWLWVLLSLFVTPFGALAYFLIGREAS